MKFLFQDIVHSLQTAILGTLGMPNHHHQKSYQFVGNFHAYFHTKNQLHHLILS